MAKPPASMQLHKDEVVFLERALSALPASAAAGAGTGDADGLLKFSYHQNPYLRVFAKVLWSGYAVVRGQIAEGHQRFAQARRDGQVSAVDAATAKSMEDAHLALEDAMTPSGSVGNFLQALRDRTLQRLWSRVCETSGLPPPRFHVLLGKGGAPTAAELEAEEEQELAALRKTPLPSFLPDHDDDDDEAPVQATGADGYDDDDGDGDESAPPTPEGEVNREEESGLCIRVRRRGGAETAAELVLSAAAEALRDLRVKQGTGALTVTVTVEGQRPQRPAQPRDTGDQQRRRRRRR